LPISRESFSRAAPDHSAKHAAITSGSPASALYATNQITPHLHRDPALQLLPIKVIIYRAVVSRGLRTPDSLETGIYFDEAELGYRETEYVIVGTATSYMATCVNAIHPTISLFDGFLIHSRGNGSAALAQEPQVAALDHWIRTGEAAPPAERLARSGDGTSLQRDRFGNAAGGIRTPYVDAPVAAFSGTGQTGSSFCFLFGTTALFDEPTLSQLYPSREDYTRPSTEPPTAPSNRASCYRWMGN
jgi:hypothetical protein